MKIICKIMGLPVGFKIINNNTRNLLSTSTYIYIKKNLHSSTTIIVILQNYSARPRHYIYKDNTFSYMQGHQFYW